MNGEAWLEEAELKLVEKHTTCKMVAQEIWVQVQGITTVGQELHKGRGKLYPEQIWPNSVLTCPLVPAL